MNLYQTDPELMEFFEQFEREAAGEEGQQLDEQTRQMAILAVLLGCQGEAQFRRQLRGALAAGVTPVMCKEIVYQAIAYLGMGRVLPFLLAANEALLEQGVALPLPGQSTTNQRTRLERGVQAQVDIFGQGMRQFYQGGHINRWLAANCFGDYYTRGGLTLAQREMITFCFLAGQGGCEPQLLSHVQGNLRLGNDKAFLTRVISQCVPYLGYPRCLNALSCIRSAAQE